MRNDQVDVWFVHLAEGVRNSDRRPGDTFSSRGEFATLKVKGLLTDMTVIIHGTALEAADFAEMRAAPSIRRDGIRDGLGAKLVWSPLEQAPHAAHAGRRALFRVGARGESAGDGGAFAVLGHAAADWWSR
jgi:hypothetical protein